MFSGVETEIRGTSSKSFQVVSTWSHQDMLIWTVDIHSIST